MNGSFRTIELSDRPFESGGLRFLTVKTPNLDGRGDICLFVPKVEKGISDLPIYMLLHGVYGSAWVWALKGGAHHTAKRLMEDGIVKPAIIAMPSDGLWGDGSAYFPHHNKKFDEWIVSDVPKALIENIPEASINSPLCIGGLSMGGFGALMLGTKYPDRFKAISAHSSITKLEQMEQFVDRNEFEEYTSYLDNPTIMDFIKMNSEKLPAIRFDCGLKDDLLDANRELHNYLLESKTPHIYKEFEGGHEWPYWQNHVEKTFVFFNRFV
tara:strand:- start:51 stop:854 length:804 start_codon:yes stop_codon:yes gene_type:complete